MKITKKSKVSWSPGPKLFQVKMFRTEDCPAKVASQPQRHNYTKQVSGKPRAPDLPPGFEGNHYANKLNISNISQIKWKQPPKLLVNDTWLVGSGGESTESLTETLRIAKVLESIYPHRSAVAASRPSVSSVIEGEFFDDSKTPVIRLTPIEDEWESMESSHDKQGQVETKPCSSQELISGLAPDMSLAASAALTAVMKTKELGSLVDPDLLIKFLSDPKMIKNLINDKTGKSSETENHQSIETNINPTRPQHITTSPMARNLQPPMARNLQPPMARNPQPSIISQEQSFTNPEQRRVSPPKLGNGNISLPNLINGNPVSTQMPVHPCVSIANQPFLPARLPAINLLRPQHTFLEPKVRLQPQPNSAFHITEMNNVQASTGLGRIPQTGFGSYPMNLNRIDPTNRPKPVVQPVKNLDYFKNLIREHGTYNHETNHNGRVDNLKVKKHCIYFGSEKGCKLGDSCMYVHDRFKPSFQTDAPLAKRVKFERYENNGLHKMV